MTDRLNLQLFHQKKNIRGWEHLRGVPVSKRTGAQNLRQSR
jgi:hypothetical protein